MTRVDSILFTLIQNNLIFSCFSELIPHSMPQKLTNKINMATKKTKSKPAWEKTMPEKQFEWMREILAAPSPIGLEAAMSYGVIKPFFEEIKPKSWAVHQFKGNASIVLDSHPGEDDRTSIMIIGHADKIRMQVRHQRPSSLQSRNQSPRTPLLKSAADSRSRPEAKWSATEKECLRIRRPEADPRSTDFPSLQNRSSP